MKSKIINKKTYQDLVNENNSLKYRLIFTNFCCGIIIGLNLFTIYVLFQLSH